MTLLPEPTHKLWHFMVVSIIGGILGNLVYDWLRDTVVPYLRSASEG